MNDPAPALETLVARIAADRDRGAFTALFHAYAPRLMGFFQRGGASPEVAGELVQDVMLRVWRGASTYAPERGAVDTWIFRIARNARCDRAGKERRHDVVPDDPAMVAATPETPHEVAERRGRAARVRAALDALPPQQAEILRAVYFGAKSMQAVADERGVPLGTVKSRIRLGFERLRAALGQGDD